MTEESRTPDKESLLTARSALIFVVALLIGACVAMLSLLASDSWPAAVLAGLIATGASLPVANKLIA